jgi:hypothetical protein
LKKLRLNEKTAYNAMQREAENPRFWMTIIKQTVSEIVKKESSKEPFTTLLLRQIPFL